MQSLNQCLSLLTLWVRIAIKWRSLSVMNRCLTYQKKCTMSCISGLLKVRLLAHKQTCFAMGGRWMPIAKEVSNTMHIVLCFCFVFLRLVYVASFSVFNAPLVFSNGYFVHRYFFYHKQHLINPGLSVCSVFNSYQTTSSHHFQSVSRNYTPPRRRKLITGAKYICSTATH
jgi:hypothetical protein